MLKPTDFEPLIKIAELFFLAELCALHLALFLVFVFWLAKHVLHEFRGLREELRPWNGRAPNADSTTPRVIPSPSP